MWQDKTIDEKIRGRAIDETTQHVSGRMGGNVGPGKTPLVSTASRSEAGQGRLAGSFIETLSRRCVETLWRRVFVDTSSRHQGGAINGEGKTSTRFGPPHPAQQ